MPSPALVLRDFDLQIDVGDGRRYPIAVLSSPAGAARGSMTFPFDSGALTAYLTSLEQALRSPAQGGADTVQEFGAALFGALMQGDILAAYDRSRQLTEAPDQGLRIKLRILAPELLTLPWEFLYDARTHEFVALSRHTPIVRYLELLLPNSDFAVTPPLRVLGVVASPTDLPALDAARERSVLEQALQRPLENKQVELTWLTHATWRELQDALQQGPWHIFHYTGHAFFDARMGEGALVMTDEQGGSWLVSATQLGRLLADHRTLRLVMLNACEGARGDEQSPFASVAAALVQHGLPAAVAMQYAISDGAAIAFADQFYGALADRLPVDAAVSEGRKAVDQASPGSLEWGTPVIFSRAADGLIWRIVTEAEQHPERTLMRRLLYPLLAILLVVLAIAGALAYPALEPLWNVWPMKGDFNIAVAEIGVLQPDGSMRPSEFGEQISAALYRTLEDAYRQVKEAGVFDRNVLIWHDSLGREAGKNLTLGFIPGKTLDERIANARALAHKVNAQMVVFGHLTDATDPESLQLEFFFDGQERAGEPSALWGGYLLGEPLQPAVSYRLNPDAAKLTVSEALTPRSRALFWMTQGLSYGLANLPERGLAILQQVEPTVDLWPSSEGKELFYLVLGDLAQKSRRFDVAIAALDKALALRPDFVPALLTLAGVYFDRAQLFPYRNQPVPADMEACISLANIENASPTLEAALEDNKRALELTQRAVALAQTQPGQLADRSLLLLGLVHRGEAALHFLQGDIAQANLALDRAEVVLQEALAKLNATDDPVYYAWAQVAMGTVARLRAHSAALRQSQAADAAARAAANAEAMQWLNVAIEHYDACLALRERTAGNVLFQRRVLGCSCEPFAQEARQTLSSLQGGEP